VKNRNIINVTLPEGWHRQLQRLANRFSLKEDRLITLSQLVREAIWTAYSGSLSGSVER
jgi:hypothetical protein